MERNKTDGTKLSTVVTASKIIELMGIEGGLTPVQIAKELNLTRSNVHRLLATLQDLGYVEEVKEKVYNLTFKLFELGNTVPALRTLVDVSRPSMLRLSQKTGYTVNSAVLYQNEVLYIDKVETISPLRFDSAIGHSEPLYATSLGKVLLAFMDNDASESIISSLVFTPSTPNTITDLNELRAEIDKVRKTGYAINKQELSLDLICLGVPVFDSKGNVCSAISLSGTSDKFSEAEALKYLPDMKAASEEISSRLHEKLTK